MGTGEKDKWEKYLRTLKEDIKEVSTKFNIRLNIAGKTYPLTIERSDEEKYRRAEKEINELVAKFRTRFRAESEDYLAMAALQISLANVELELSRSLGEDIDRLVDLEKTINDYFDSIG